MRQNAEEIERDAGNTVKTIEGENKRMTTKTAGNSGVIYKKVKLHGSGERKNT